MRGGNFMSETDNTQNTLICAAKELQPQLEHWYRHLHRYPEMAHKEFKTHA